MPQITTQALALLLLTILVYHAPAIYKNTINNIKLSAFPTVGCSGFLTSYVGAYRFWKHSISIVQEGYDRYRGSIFKVATMRCWIIVVSGADKIDDIRHASDEFLSFAEAAKEITDIDVGIGSEAFRDHVHVDVVRSPLTRNIGVRYPDVLDEIVVALNDYIPIKGDEWIKVRAFPTMLDIVCRAGNRMLVGLPLCRNADYLGLSKKFVIDIVIASEILKRLPLLIKPIAARFTKVPRTIERGMKHMEPLVEERLEQEALHGKDWSERPNDILTWLLDVSKGKQRSLKDITIRVLLVNFAAIHTTTRTLTNVLFDLATYPEYVQPLREEIEKIVQQEDWSKDAIDKMGKLDSFIKESLRIASLHAFGIMRKVMKDFTFSDGTTIPAGNTIAIPISSLHTDPDIYPYADKFDGFRFEKMRQKEGKHDKHRFVSIEADYHLFGSGRHACPGRYFAAIEVKTILAQVLMNYDVKFVDGLQRPAPMWFGENARLDPTAELLFRKRV